MARGPSAAGMRIGDDQGPPGSWVEAPEDAMSAHSQEQTQEPRPELGGKSGEPSGGASGSITLTVNGETRTCPAGLRLPQVLEALGYRPALVVVEFNGEILPRQAWDGQGVGGSDVLEVVTIVGGGS